VVEGLRLRLGTALVAANNGFTLGVRAPGQTYKQCLAANSANYSLAGAFNQDSGTAKLVAGNDVASLLFGDASEGQAGLLLAEGGAHSVSAGIGTVGTMGRRTGRVALPKYPFYSKGCPVQAPLGRGRSDVTDSRFAGDYGSVMPWGLKRFHESRQLHFLTFSCFHRRPNFPTPNSRTTFESSLERVRQDYGLRVYGYVVMPEHVHLLVSEPERDTLARALQSLKQSVARRLALRAADPFWQARYYDFNVWSEMKFVEKLRYIHRNPVKRGLVAQPEDWAWSSFRHYLTGETSAVEIESQWTACRREQLGIFPTVGMRPAEENPTLGSK
jgi:putative transposase